jgi:hypothetical protein
MNIEVNFVAVLLAAIVSMVVGFLWYSPMLFGKPWAKLMGFTAESLKKAQKTMGPMYALSFVAALVTAYVLSHVMTLSENTFHYARMATGVSTAFWVWLGFVAPVQLTDVIFGGKKWNLFFINSGYQLASLVVMGVALSLL